jgi:methyl-accepting chemotaxis protein
MPLRNELVLTIGSLFVLNLLLVFGAIGLFTRMGPAIERILEENVLSIIAAEEMLATFAGRGGVEVPESERVQVLAAYERARANVTEPEELPVLDAIASALPAAFDGEAGARRALVRAVSDLIEINRLAMRRVDHDAQRLGRGGAWAAAFIGLLTLGISLVVVRRLGARVVGPLADLERVVASARAGDSFRRCAARNAAREIRQVAAAVNALLDARIAAADEVVEGTRDGRG